MSSQEEQTNDDDYNEGEHYEEDFDDFKMIEIPSVKDDNEETLDEFMKRRKKEEEQLIEIERLKNRKKHIEELKAFFNPTSNAANVIVDDYQTYRDTPKEDLPFTAGPVGNNLFTWNVYITKFPPDSDLEKDMIQYKKKNPKNYNGIELRVLFPPDYPNHPPFVHVVRPRFQFHTGRVTVGGSLCMEILTHDKWATISFLSLFTMIVTDIFAGNPRINLDSDVPYSLEEAKEAYVRVAKDHGWTPSWIPSRTPE